METRDVVFDEGKGSGLEQVEIDLVTKEMDLQVPATNEKDARERTHLPASKTAPDLSDKSSDGGDSERGDWETLNEPQESQDDTLIATDRSCSPSESTRPPKARRLPATLPHAYTSKCHSRKATWTLSGPHSTTSSQKIYSTEARASTERAVNERLERVRASGQ